MKKRKNQSRTNQNLVLFLQIRWFDGLEDSGPKMSIFKFIKSCFKNPEIVRFVGTWGAAAFNQVHFNIEAFHFKGFVQNKVWTVENLKTRFSTGATELSLSSFRFRSLPFWSVSSECRTLLPENVQTSAVGFRQPQLNSGVGLKDPLPRIFEEFLFSI